MPRPRPSVRALAGLLAAVPPLLALAPSAGAARSSGDVARVACSISTSDPRSGEATFSIQARDLRPASTSYGFRVRLQQRRPGDAWSTSSLLRFQAARPGAQRMVRRITVRGLAIGSAYRLRVAFRWRRPDGTTRTATRTSRSCRVVDARPDVAVDEGRIGWTPAPTAGEVVYRVPLTGRATARVSGGQATVAVLQSGQELARARVDLADGGFEALVPGRRCSSAAPLRVVVDPDGEIDERDESNNVQVLPCPSVAG